MIETNIRRTGKKCILAVDDAATILLRIKDTLEDYYDVVTVNSGMRALRYLEKVKPDLILLDLMLPGLSGEEVLPLVLGIPVIVVSAKADVGEKVKLLRKGAADYITKPFDTRELLARMEVQLRMAASSLTGRMSWYPWAQ